MKRIFAYAISLVQIEFELLSFLTDTVIPICKWFVKLPNKIAVNFVNIMVEIPRSAANEYPIFKLRLGDFQN